MSFRLEELKERGPGYVLVDPCSQIFIGSTCGLRIKLIGHADGNLGQQGWQVAEFTWQVDLFEATTGNKSAVLIPDIVRYLKQNHNYKFEFDNDGNFFSETIPWRGIRPIGKVVDEGLQTGPVTSLDVNSIVEPLEPISISPPVKITGSPKVILCDQCNEQIINTMQKCPWCNAARS